MTKELFELELKKIGINLTKEISDKIELYADLLLEYNEKVNITSIRNKKEVYLKHFYDSLTLAKAIDLNKKLNVLDIGSGGGFPGIVIGIVYPNLNITLLDSNHKKTDFQNYIIEKLALKNINTVNLRAEDYFKVNKKYDLVVARAVANMVTLSELCIPFVKRGGYFIAMKGDFKDEIDSSLYAIETLGGRKPNIITFNLPEVNDVRNLVVVQKERDTPKGYPRKYDQILKKPLIKRDNY